MIPGTSKKLSKYGPGDLLFITKMLQNIQENLWNHPGQILFLSIWDSQISKIFENMYVLGTTFVCVVFRLFFSSVFVCGNLCTYLKKNYHSCHQLLPHHHEDRPNHHHQRYSPHLRHGELHRTTPSQTGLGA